MADMVGFLVGLEKSLFATLDHEQKRERFVEHVLAQNNDYRRREQVLEHLQKWADNIQMYNTINHSHVDYGYARLDAFGRIYNRVLQHVLNRHHLAKLLRRIETPDGEYLLTKEQVEQVLDGINGTVLHDDEFRLISERLQSSENGDPGLGRRDMLRIRDAKTRVPVFAR